MKSTFWMTAQEAENEIKSRTIVRDAYTMRHLNDWLEREVNDDTCRGEVKAAMLSLYDDDPEYWMSQSWWNLFDRVKGDRILARYM